MTDAQKIVAGKAQMTPALAAIVNEIVKLSAASESTARVDYPLADGSVLIIKASSGEAAELESA